MTGKVYRGRIHGINTKVPSIFNSFSTYEVPLLLMGFKLMAGAVASFALIGVAVGVGTIYGSLLINRNKKPIAKRLHVVVLIAPVHKSPGQLNIFIPVHVLSAWF